MHITSVFTHKRMVQCINIHEKSNVVTQRFILIANFC